MIKKRGRLGRFWWRPATGAHGSATVGDPPPFLHFQRTKQHRTKAQNTKQSSKRTPRHARRASAVADILVPTCILFRLPDGCLFPTCCWSKRPSSFCCLTKRIFVESGSVFASNLAPFWAPRIPQDRPMRRPRGPNAPTVHTDPSKS